MVSRWLTDGGSHGSYVSGTAREHQVELVRRWQTGTEAHEQFYRLTLDGSGQVLVGTFTEPAFEPATHTVRFERGSADRPRRSDAPKAAPEQIPIDTVVKEMEPNPPCDCKLVCWCGGVAPGRERDFESARCGGSCKCKPCPPLP